MNANTHKFNFVSLYHLCFDFILKTINFEDKKPTTHNLSYNLYQTIIYQFE